MRRLTNDVGPLFVVIDDIGVPFSHTKLDDKEKRDQLMMFCETVLFPLLPVRNLFFLVVGRNSFLSYGKLDPTSAQGMKTISVNFERLSLNLLRPNAIENIIENTYVDNANTETIKDHCKLTDDQVEDVAIHLYKTTFGHPRKLLGALKKSRSYDELMMSTGVQDTYIDWIQFGNRLRYYQTPLRYMMDHVLSKTNTLINMSTLWRDTKSNYTPCDHIANRFGIA
ncbi:hypothetical protein PC110_g12302 [Phytophthora cactorum]|uniref:Uncharacterized protein n=2 Tax=Phytophthora cactorum TaxID=29920 RepID=A0A329S322_9STRA|nr:hypothetical protein PC110_g12302 [Phytophthora cactorum]